MFVSVCIIAIFLKKKREKTSSDIAWIVSNFSHTLDAADRPTPPLPPSSTFSLSLFLSFPEPASCDWSAGAGQRRPNWSVIIISAFARGVAFPPIGNPLPCVINSRAQARVLARGKAAARYRRRLVHPLWENESRPDGISLCLSGYDQ